MSKFIGGFILGVVVSTIGFAGVARWLDQGVTYIKSTTEQAVQK